MTKWWIVVLGVALAGAGAAVALAPRTPQRTECTTIDACVVELRAMAHAPGVYASSMNKGESEFIQRVAGMEGALPALMPLLTDADRAVAEMAAKALHAYQKPIDAKYLPQVRAGLDRNLVWLPAVLGNITSDEAAEEAVARFLVSRDAPDNQEAFAVVRAGARAIPFILRTALCERGCGEDDITNLSSVLEDMGRERAAAVPGLLAIAENQNVSDETAGDALWLLRALGRDGARAEPALVELRLHRPALALRIDSALVSMHSHRAGAIFAERLRKHPNTYALQDAAEVGTAAYDAGPVIAPLLSDPDPDIRLSAARALGFIGYRPAVDALIATLDDPFDVRLAWASAESLGRLGDARAVPALERIAQQHWYPAVRDTAARASASLKARTPYVGKHDFAQTHHFPTTFLAFTTMGDGIANCRKPLVAPVESHERRLASPKDAGGLANLAYPALLASQGMPPPPPLEPGFEREYARMRAENLRRLKAEPPILPDLAVRVDDGWFVASNRGEFGGELVFVGDDRKQQWLLSGNVEDVHVLGHHIIAIAGLAHLTGNAGAIYDIVRAPDGRWRATQWRILPGAPEASWPVATGELLIQVYGGGTVLVSADGSMRMAPCRAQGGGKSDGSGRTSGHDIRAVEPLQRAIQ